MSKTIKPQLYKGHGYLARWEAEKSYRASLAARRDWRRGGEIEEIVADDEPQRWPDDADILSACIIVANEIDRQRAEAAAARLEAAEAALAETMSLMGAVEVYDL